MNQLVSRLLAGAGIAAALAFAPASWAQGNAGASRPVVQPIPGVERKNLNAALARIGRDPRDVAALTDAGDAARQLHDYAAALGFYKRAQEVDPGNGRVQAGLASALVMTGDPVGAITAFNAAEKAGFASAQVAADRGLAYDLVGDNVAAQRYYAMALPSATGGDADELRMRLAVSQAIAGDQTSAYATLLPLLNRQDKPGWRTHAFTLAIGGDTNKAVEVVGKILPGTLAENISPYLRYMPRLTRAQQAAAANLGRFPRASEIGRDDERIAAYTPSRTLAAGNGLIPRGEPLGGRTAKPTPARGRQARQAANTPTQRPAQVAATDPDRVAPPEPHPTIERGAGELPPVAGATPAIRLPAALERSASVARESARTTVPARSAPVSSAPARVAEAGAGRSASPGFDLGRLPASQAATPPLPASPAVAAPSPQQRPAIILPSQATLTALTQRSVPVPETMQSAPATVPAAAATPAATPAAPPSLSQIFADLGTPAVEAAPVPGAVDVRTITPLPPAPRVQIIKAPAKADDAQEPVAELADAKTKGAKVRSAKGKPAETKLAAADEADEPPLTAREARTKAAQAKAKADARAKAKKPVPPPQPSRIWVQIGVGRNESAIAFDWRRNLRENPKLLKGRQPHIADMGRTNRILIGPFPTQKAANAFLGEARKQGFGDALPWTSPEGQAVDPLSK
ncbi:tetratricopeptide repeat protein [Novosphingobium sp. Leaf2]|uniref:tetratricopeptide repeat protein n=1 Tax=Novosphingobium sp. Leaf2 TaxID=1735670 RepID=UPI0006FF1CAC|nr:SPOR domain-containing protein [Novosphingobium sp. Leaf2]KQM19112.1 sporulation protein SsgA [Novosphingobium sp. Leaf2]